MKRFTDTDIWDEDWFLDLDCDHQRLWFFIKDKCNHAGIWKPNIKRFNALLECNIDIKTAFDIFNQDRMDKPRVIKLKNGHWFLPGFFVFQNGNKLNLNNNAHLSVYKIYEDLSIDLNDNSIYGLLEVKERSVRGLKDPQGKGNSKGNSKSKGKGKKDNVFIPPTEKEFTDYFIENGFSKELARKAFIGYSYADPQWTDTYGNKINNWKLKAQKVWFKDENKNKKVVQLNDQIARIEEIEQLEREESQNVQ